jgi:hypothetical protein
VAQGARAAAPGAPPAPGQAPGRPAPVGATPVGATPPGATPPGAAEADHAGPDPAPAAGQVRLVGREHELGLLQERWQDALRGSAGFAVLAGEAGVGKTRLLDELSSQVQRAGFDTMRARCLAARGRLALAPVSEWLRSPALRLARERLEPVRSTGSCRRPTPTRCHH